MKRNRFGMNLDEGVPLSSETDFQQLYVPCSEDISNSLKDWIEDSTENGPMMFGGQIGSGKSTLITKILLESSQKPYITLHFDREGLNLDNGDFLSITLAGFIEKALVMNTDLSCSELPSEIFKLGVNDWHGVTNLLCPKEFSMKSFEDKCFARKTISENAEYIKTVICKIGEQLKTSITTPLFILASGIDKYENLSPAFFSLRDSLKVISQFKTLYEVNATHFFLPKDVFYTENKLFISVVNEEDIIEILKKRMGVYAGPIKEELTLIAKWSGGNPRQAVRLLVQYEAARKNKNNDKTKKLALAIQRTTADLFAFSVKPTFDLIKTILIDSKIETSLITLPGDKETAKLALYGNWILITGPFENGSWPAIVNPLTKSSFVADKNDIAGPEYSLLLQYAEANHMSPEGLSYSMLNDDGVEKSGEEILHEFLASGVERPVPTKLTEILDVISAALLSKDRADRIMIGFKDKRVLNAARSYLFAKANSYEYQRFEHTELAGGENRGPLKKLEQHLAMGTDIYSFEFSGKWTENQLNVLDKHRDRFIDNQMIWWIPLEDLEHYLPYWIQLRGFFELFILEDELLGSLTVEDIEADLAFFEGLTESKESSEAMVVDNLKIVLEYLKQNKGGNNGQ